MINPNVDQSTYLALYQQKPAEDDSKASFDRKLAFLTNASALAQESAPQQNTDEKILSLVTNQYTKQGYKYSEGVYINASFSYSGHNESSFFQDKSQCLSSPTPIDSWSEEEVDRAVDRLQVLKIPLASSSVKKIYTLIRERSDLFNPQPERSYSLCYKGEAREGAAQFKKPFALEFYNRHRITLIFLGSEKPFRIGKGFSKTVQKAYALGIPHKLAYGITHLSIEKGDHSVRALKRAEQEEHIFQRLSNRSSVAKVYNFSYYLLNCNRTRVVRQSIEMECYPIDLLDYFEENLDEISEQRKNIWYQQLIKLVSDIHQNKIAHGDFKCENILIDNHKNLFLTDFGMAIDLVAYKEEVKTNGTTFYLAPETLNNQTVKDVEKVDCWALGCAIWLLFNKAYPPWSREIENFKKDKENPERLSTVFNKMKHFEANPAEYITPENLIRLYILWRLLRFDPKERLSAIQANVLFLMLQNLSAQNSDKIDFLILLENYSADHFLMYLKSFKNKLSKEYLDYLHALEARILERKMREDVSDSVFTAEPYKSEKHHSSSAPSDTSCIKRCRQDENA